MSDRDSLLPDRGSLNRLSDQPAPQASEHAVEHAPVPIEIGLMWSEIDQIDDVQRAAPSDLPIDAISVGHYTGTTSMHGAERALDIAVSRALQAGAPNREIPGAERILTAYARRGVIRGELGQMFFLPDPRTSGPAGRVIALAGLGAPGRFCGPELTLMARELCWTLGRMGKRHLATVLIGSGDGNLSVIQALIGWIRGIRAAVCSMEHDPRLRLARVTFVTYEARRALQLDKTIRGLAEQEAQRPAYKPRLEIRYTRLSRDTLRNGAGQSIGDALMVQSRRGLTRDIPPPAPYPVPARIHVEQNGKGFSFSAITDGAAVSERVIETDPALIMEGNARLPDTSRLYDQIDMGQYMAGLILPKDLYAALSGNAPIVMMVDAAAARIHWEMVAEPRADTCADVSFPLGAITSMLKDSGSSATTRLDDGFLGIGRGLSRQLLTRRVLPPEPPPPRRRNLRVLVVADPTGQLEGAREEGVRVAEIFQAFNTAWKQDNYGVEVVALIGPERATRTEVLYSLMRKGPYDILHYAGHCAYDENSAHASGWIFAGGQMLSIHEIDRIDRIPRFVFSNACVSGVIPPSSMAPSFASAFFERGVANFVCTAWKVDDAAATTFAIELYAALLGLTVTVGPDGARRYGVDRVNGPRSMYVGMRQARLRLLADALYGGGETEAAKAAVRTWGAYQHYGDPYFQIFDQAVLKGVETQEAPTAEAVEDRDDGRAAMLPHALVTVTKRGPPFRPGGSPAA